MILGTSSLAVSENLGRIRHNGRGFLGQAQVPDGQPVHALIQAGHSDFGTLGDRSDGAQLPRRRGGGVFQNEEPALGQLKLGYLRAQLHRGQPFNLFLPFTSRIHPSPVGRTRRAESLTHGGHEHHQRRLFLQLPPETGLPRGRKEVDPREEIQSARDPMPATSQLRRNLSWTENL
eukprot:2040027-Pyramimonas_sp.AAC.1